MTGASDPKSSLWLLCWSCYTAHVSCSGKLSSGCSTPGRILLLPSKMEETLSSTCWQCCSSSTPGDSLPSLSQGHIQSIFPASQPQLALVCGVLSLLMQDLAFCSVNFHDLLIRVLLMAARISGMSTTPPSFVLSAILQRVHPVLLSRPLMKM